MATNTVTNWFGNIVSHPRVIVDANSVADIVAVLRIQRSIPRLFVPSDPITQRLHAVSQRAARLSG